jgi:hypothetical protein
LGLGTGPIPSSSPLARLLPDPAERIAPTCSIFRRKLYVFTVRRGCCQIPPTMTRVIVRTDYCAGFP